jgi:hypothetical protein
VNAKQRLELRQLAEGLLSVPRERFTIHHWRLEQAEGECGFAGCAIGWASVLIPGCELQFTTFIRLPEFKGKVGFWAVADYFGIGIQEAIYLFHPENYSSHVTPEIVSNRILEFLQKEIGQ